MVRFVHLLMLKNSFKISILLTFAFAIFAAGKLLNFSIRTNIKGENPGYFDQWFQEKKNANGEIPQWQQASWAAWDKQQVRNRSGEEIIDTIIQMGPANIGGRTRSVWIDPRNDQVILAAAISGGVWRSEDGGKSWKALNDVETTLMASCFTHNPFNPDIIYYGTGEGRGNSAGYFVRDIGGNGIYKSTDGGKTFKVLPATVGLAGFDIIWDIKHSLTDSNTFFVGTDSKGLFRTTDGGNSFEQVLNVSNLKVTNLLTLPNNRLLVGVYTKQIYVSDSGGKKNTFSALSVVGWPGSGAVGRVQLANCRKYPNVVYALVEGFGYYDNAAGFFKSSNGGKNWIKQVAPSAIGTGQAAYNVMLGASPVDSNVAVAGGVNIAQTNNGGSSWSAKSVGHSDHHSFAAFYTNTNFFLIGTDGGIYKYRYNSSAVQENLNNGYNVTQFYAGNYGPTGFASIGGTQDNGTHVGTGSLKTSKFYGADGAYSHIGLQTGKIAYLSTQNEGIRRITNFNPNSAPAFSDGISDSRFATDGVNFINAYAINPADEYQLYYRTNKYLYRTTDGGDGWDIITNQRSGLKAIGVSNETNPVVYTGGSAGQLYRINNAATVGAASETSFNLAVPASITNDFLNCIVVHPKDRNTIFMAFSNYSVQPRIWRASGFDSSKPVFKNISGNLPVNLPVNFVATDPQFPDKNLFAATDFGLYYSTDSGKIWVKETRIPNVAIHEIKMRADRTLFIYTHGRGLWYLTLIPAAGVHKPSSKVDFKCYPNPADKKLNIALPQVPKDASYVLFDLQGKSILEGKLVNSNEIVDVSNLTSGYYYIRVINGTRTETQKVLITH